MALAAKTLTDPVTLTTSFVARCTGPSSKTWIVKQIILTNYSASAATVDIRLVPASATAGNEHLIFKALSLAAYETTLLNMSLVLETSDAIFALASAGTAVNLTIFGVEVS